MPSSVSKAALRQSLMARLADLPTSQLQAETRAIVDHLTRWTQTRGFDVFLATLPLPGEPDLTPFLRGTLAAGAGLALARTGRGRSLEFLYVSSVDGPWEERPYGLREPPVSMPAWVPGPSTLVLVPGLGFAPAPGGGALRLGRGAGYYDRWLAVNGGSVFTLGIGLSVQSLDHLPTEDHDRPLDGWLDPAGFHGLLPVIGPGSPPRTLRTAPPPDRR
jgi:5-formyltetrahydrofolate cyclo-ligase